MWFFSSPQIIFGDDALSYLGNLTGRHACLVSDKNLVKLGIVERVCNIFSAAGMQVSVFDEVETEPSLETVRVGQQFLLKNQPDWIVALGGGSVIDATKAMWILYERPDVDPAGISPAEILNLRQKARLIAIPTTTGTGSESTWGIVLTDIDGIRKLGLGNREAIPDFAILDPELVKTLPARLTADTGLDALTHAIEGYTSTFHNDFCDGLCLKAASLVFEYLPIAYQNGDDLEARMHLQNAASIAGLGFGNSMAALAHGMGHSFGGVFRIPHGRAVALFLPYTIEYCGHQGEYGSRYYEIARFLNLVESSRKVSLAAEASAAVLLMEAVRRLEQSVAQPLTIQECGISWAELNREMDVLVENALNDSQTMLSNRIPDAKDLQKLFQMSFA
jgi:alcohol dehydrogenase class IV